MSGRAARRAVKWKLFGRELRREMYEAQDRMLSLHLYGPHRFVVVERGRYGLRIRLAPS